MRLSTSHGSIRWLRWLPFPSSSKRAGRPGAAMRADAAEGPASPSMISTRNEPRLEVIRQFAGDGARADVVRPRERGEEVVERVLVADVDDGERRGEGALVGSLAVQQVVLADGQVEQVARRDAGWVVVVVLGVGSGVREQRRGKLRTQARVRERPVGRGADAGARETGLGLLIGGELRSGGILKEDCRLTVKRGGLWTVVRSERAVA